jgi:Ran GTPase-activating protein (RanGAP) involved in mRNA processing and transport
LVLRASDLTNLSSKLRQTPHLKSLSIAIQEAITIEAGRELEHGILKNRSLRHLTLKLLEVQHGVLNLLVSASVRNPCLLTLDLSQTPFPSVAIVPQSQAELFGLKSPMVNLRKLNLNRCHLSELELGAIAEFLSQTSSSLTYLDISGNHISPKSAAAMASSMKKNNSLTTLRMRDCGLGDSGINELSKFLSINTCIDHLNISSNDIGPEGAKSLAQGIEQNKSVGHLNASHNPFLPAGLEHILEAISKNDSLRELDLGFCAFGRSTWSILAQSINTWSKLWKLNISGNMQYRTPAFAALCSSFASSSLSSSSPSSPSSPRATSSSFLSVPIQGFVSMDLSISPPPPSFDSMLAISSDLATSPSSSSNDILRAGSPLRSTVAAKRAAMNDQAEYVKSLEELCSALQVNSSVSILDLSHNPFGDLGCKVLGSLLASNQTLVELKLKRCGISMKGMSLISAGVTDNIASALSFVDSTGNEADGLGSLGDSILRNRRDKLLAWRPVRSHPIVQTKPHAEFTSLCPVPSIEEIWVACSDGHVHFWPVSDVDNVDDVMHYVDVHSKPVPVTRRRINGMITCKSTVWVLTDESTIIVISQSKPHRISYLPSTADTLSERLCMCIVDHDNQIAVLGGGSGDISLWKTSAGEESMITRKVLGAGFPVVAVASTPNLILAGLVMPGRHSSIVVILDHALEELYRQEVGTEPLSSMSCFGNMVITAFQNNSVRLWHCDSREMALARSYAHIPTQSIQPMQSFYISSSLKRSNMCIWNPSTLTPVCILDTPQPIKSIAISGPYMAILTEDEQLGLWVKKKKKNIPKICMHFELVEFLRLKHH